MEGTEARPLVSVIIPVRDDPDRVGELIRSLADQTLPRDQFEIVVGDDGSEPGSLARVLDSDGSVRIVAGPPKTSYAARNRAARAARGSVFAFCDSDCLPERNWLEEGLGALAAADLAAGEVRFSAPAKPTRWSLLTIDMFLDQERNVLLGRAVTANLFVRRNVFDELGGFDESLPSGGDYDFVARSVEAGARLDYAPTAVVRHPTLDDRRGFLRKVWATNKWSAARRARGGARPDLGVLLTFVPVLGAVRARRHALRSLSMLSRPRLRASGIEAGWREDLRALPALYLVVAYVAGFARIRGWRVGRRLRTEVPADGSAGSFAETAQRP